MKKLFAGHHPGPLDFAIFFAGMLLMLAFLIWFRWFVEKKVEKYQREIEEREKRDRYPIIEDHEKFFQDLDDGMHQFKHF